MGRKTKAMVVFYLIMMLVIASGCDHINSNRIKDLSSREYENFTLYYSNPDCIKHIEDYSAIVNNMTAWMEQRYGFHFKEFELNVIMVPLENDVVDFEKRGSSACTDYKNIFLLDFKNLDNEIYMQYGEPPEDIYNNAFTHELGHVLSHNRIQFKKSNRLRPEEMHSVFLTYIDFTNIDYNCTQALQDDIISWYNNDRIEKLHEEGLECLKDATGERAVSVFLYYLYDTGNVDRLKLFLESDSLSDFIKDAGWSEDDNQKFTSWIEYMKSSVMPVQGAE